MAYLHGTYGELRDPSVNSATSKSVVVYVGTAPIHKIPGGGKKAAELVNKPLKITGLTTARNLLGYSEKAPFTYTLMEAVEAHFKNNIENVGPIYVINVFNPFEATNQKATDEKEFPVVKKQASFLLGDMVYDEITIKKEEEALVEGTDFNKFYDFATDTVTIKVIGSKAPTITKIKVGGKTVSIPEDVKTAIIGEVAEDGTKTGLKAIENIYRLYDEITNVIAAPGYSEVPEVYEAMVQAATKINGHWDAFVNADIPAKTNAKIADAINWKKENGYDYGNSKVYWPLAKRRDGKVFHLSTLATAEMLKQDMANDGVPFVSVSNKEVDVADQCGADTFHGFDLDEGNLLNEEGITTLVKWGGVYRLWGPHTAQYATADQENGTQDPRYQFDTSVRTLLHITNAFQKDNFDDIDKPMSTALKDQIIQREQAKLDALVCKGALIGETNKIFFSEENDDQGIMNGNFIWDIQTTTTVPFKSGTVKVGWTAEGLNALGGDQ